MSGMYPLVVGTISTDDGKDVQVLLFPNGLVVSTNMGTKQGDHVRVCPNDIPAVAHRLVNIVVGESDLPLA